MGEVAEAWLHSLLLLLLFEFPAAAQRGKFGIAKQVGHDSVLFCYLVKRHGVMPPAESWGRSRRHDSILFYYYYFLNLLLPCSGEIIGIVKQDGAMAPLCFTI